ncbi:MAG: PAS domain-containing protein [Salibacteraceae bacterium]
MLKPLDLEETKRLKEAVLADPNNYQSITENTKLSVCGTNVDGEVVHVNENYTKYSGYNRDNILGQHFTILVPEDQQEKLEELHDRFFERQFQMLRFWQTKHIKGHQVNIQADAQLIKLADGSPHKVMFIQPEEE